MRTNTTTSQVANPAVLPQFDCAQTVTGLLDEGAAANVLSCSVAFLRRCRLLCRGPAYIKVGRLVRYSMGDLQAYIHASTQRTASVM
jgi:hypothetical protein